MLLRLFACDSWGGLLEPLSSHDVQLRYAASRGWFHVCWGAITPAHVGKHQAKGAPDFGVLVPLCQAAHDYYDHHRSDWARVTGYSEKKMALAASGYALKYVEHGGVQASAEQPTP